MREQQEQRQQEARQASPRRSHEQATPEPERLVTPAEEQGQSVQELEEPPQAEGDRDDG